MFEFINTWLENRKKAKKQRLRDKLAKDLNFIRTHDNRGLLHRRLFNMPEVTSVHTQSGGLAGSWVDVTMNDGYTIVGHGTWETEALQDAVKDVVKRLKEKHEL